MKEINITTMIFSMIHYITSLTMQMMYYDLYQHMSTTNCVREFSTISIPSCSFSSPNSLSPSPARSLSIRPFLLLKLSLSLSLSPLQIPPSPTLPSSLSSPLYKYYITLSRHLLLLSLAFICLSSLEMEYYIVLNSLGEAITHTNVCAYFDQSYLNYRIIYVWPIVQLFNLCFT